jgi:hypothetical protein
MDPFADLAFHLPLFINFYLKFISLTKQAVWRIVLTTAMSVVLGGSRVQTSPVQWHGKKR